MNKNTLYTYMHNCEKVWQSFFVNKDKEIDFEGRCFIVDFFFLSQYCENVVESQKKWLFLYQSCRSQYND